MLRLHDTATGTVHPLELRDPTRASLYVCGPTVYDLPHLGHGRYSLVFDVLRRYLLFTGIDVSYVSNITDVDDNIIRRANEQGCDESQIAKEYEDRWWEAMDALGVLRPDATPHATEYVPQMVVLIQELMARGLAYETSEGVYLSAEQIEGYGLLARQPLESLRAGARVETGDEKRSPIDFALWKKAKQGEPSWDSPWGAGRPGWHTECVVMSLDLLGEGFDIHGGGQDLAFPHHENERAQAIGVGRIFAKHWVHNGWVVVDGEKMSKSLGNFTSLTDLLERSDARAYRLLVLRSHYRSPMEVTPETINDAERGLARLDALARRFSLPDFLALSGIGYLVLGNLASQREEGTLDAGALEEFRTRMDSDLDTPRALAAVFDLVNKANSLADSNSGGALDRSVEDAGDRFSEARRLAITAGILCAALGLSLNGHLVKIDPESQRLVDERDRARSVKDWAQADKLRDELTVLGWVVEDGPNGTIIRH